MKVPVLIGFLMAFAALSNAQPEWEVVQMSGINSAFSEIPAYIRDRELCFFASKEKDLLHEEEWRFSGDLIPYRVSVAEGFARAKNDPSALEFDADIIGWGGLTYCAKTGTWYISCPGKGKKNQLSIATADTSGGLSWIVSDAKGYTILHPAISIGGDQLLFSSNMPGGLGGFDLYISNQVGANWSEPINLRGLNSEADDVFPAWWNNMIAFSSNRSGGSGGLDLYVSENQNWQTSVALPAPANSASDDFAVVAVGDNIAYFASNRNEGKGSDDIWILRRIPATQALNNYTGKIRIGNTGLREVGLRIYNELGIIVDSCVTDEYGKFPLKGIATGREFIIETTTGHTSLSEAAIIEIADATGKILKRISSDGKGRFRFAMLPYDDPGELILLENPDESILVINLAGRAFSDEPGDVISGERVYLLDNSGRAESLTYTGKEGDFEFKGVDPKATYNIAVDPGSALKKIQLQGEEEVLSLEGGMATYTRLEEGEYKEILLADGRAIQVKPGEALFVAEITYAFDSHVPDKEAQERLKSLASILLANTGLIVELRSHTDCRGSREYNKALSDRRAKTAESHLIACGVPAKRLKSIGLGEQQLLNSCDDSRECTEDEHAVNRRTELIILPD
jgi:outer membrane protein OmpA-like peptidoglycan-associated protein